MIVYIHMEELKPQYIEVVVRGNEKEIEKLAKEFSIDEFLFGVSENRFSYQIPISWTGWFKDRILEVISDKFGKNAYFGIAFVSVSDKIVVDENGELIEPFIVLDNNVKKKKWVKKRMLIIDTEVSDSETWFYVYGWKYDGRYNPPLVKFLEIKSLDTDQFNPCKLGLFVKEYKNGGRL